MLNEGVLIINENHRILFANARFVEMTVIPRQDLVGSYASQFYSSQKWDFVAGQIDAEFRDGHNRYAFVLPRRDGSRLPAVTESTPKRRGTCAQRDAFIEMFAELNRFLIEDIGAGMFVNVAAARIDTHLGKMVFSSAGHPPAMLVRRGQSPLLLQSRSTILGALPDAIDTTPRVDAARTGRPHHPVHRRHHGSF